MADGKLGWGATLWAGLSAPRRLFEAVKTGQVGPRPFPSYVVISAVAAAGTGLELGRVLHQSTVGLALGLGAATLVLSPLAWWIDVRVTHWMARWFGGEGSLDETRAAVGFSAIPTLAGLAPYAALPASIWALLVRARGLAILHRMKSWRALSAAFSSSVSLIVVPVMLAILLRFFVLEAFKVPAGSMFPSIEVGDHLFVAKSHYGIFNKSAPTRGDVVVFEYPEREPGAPAVDYIKRVIGIPGDSLAFEHGLPIINGWRVPHCSLGKVTVALDGFDGADVADYEILAEFLEGRAYLIALDHSHDDGARGPFLVGAGEYWVLGDNRNNSSDSRAWNGGRGGGVPLQNTRGLARWLWFPTPRLGIDLAGPPTLPRSIQQLEPELRRCLAAAPERALTVPPAPREAGPL